MQSKLRFRNVYPEVHKEKYEQVQPATSSSDSGLIKGNTKYLSFAWKAGGGGSLAVLDLNKPQRLNPVIPLIKGHTGAIQDQDFNPFNENIIATASDDTTVKIWEIPEVFDKDVTDSLVTLAGHGRKVNFVQFHPAADQILASASGDSTVKIWDVERQKDAFTLTAPDQNYWSLAWNVDGSLIGTTAKDKQTRIGDPRTEQWAHEFLSHEGSRAQKMTFLGDTGLVLTVGFAKTTDREFKLWTLKNTKEPLQSVKIDQQASVLYPFWDGDVGMLYLAGRGDGNIRYYEFSEGALVYTSDHRSTTPQKGIGFIPKRGVNVMKNELMRGLKLTDNYIEFISFIQPRKAQNFQEDLYPDCFSEVPAQTAADWLAGNNVQPLRRSMKPDEQGESPKPRVVTHSTTNPEVEKLRKLLEEAHKEIENLKAQQNQPGSNHEVEQLQRELHRMLEEKNAREQEAAQKEAMLEELRQQAAVERTSEKPKLLETIEELKSKIGELETPLPEKIRFLEEKQQEMEHLQQELETLKQMTQ